MRVRLSPLTLAISVAVWLLALYAAWCEPTSPLVTRADLFGSYIGSALVGFFSRLIGGNSGGSGAAVGRAILNLEDGLKDLNGGFQNFVGKMGSWLGGFLNVFRYLRDNALLPLLRWLRERITWLQGWLKRMLGPVLSILTRVRKHILDFYAKFVRPVLDIIDAIRFVLGTLSRLGVEWAGALDAKLAAIESAIIRNFQLVLGQLNRLIDVVDSVITFELLFQRVPFLRTFQRDLSHIWSMTLLSRDPGDIKPIPPAPHSLEEIRGDVEDAFLTGGGRYGPFIRESEQIWRRYLDVH